MSIHPDGQFDSLNIFRVIILVGEARGSTGSFLEVHSNFFYFRVDERVEFFLSHGFTFQLVADFASGEVIGVSTPNAEKCRFQLQLFCMWFVPSCNSEVFVLVLNISFDLLRIADGIA